MRLQLYIPMVVLIIAFTGTFISAEGQNFRQLRQELEEQQDQTRQEIESLQEQINTVQQEISETEDAYEQLYQQYQNTRREISLRDALIENKLEERDQLEDELEMLQTSIEQLLEDLEYLIEQYKETLTYVYKHGRTSSLALILSAGSFNQMMVRARYLQEFEEHRRRQARQIEEKQAELRREEQDLEKARERVAENIRETEAEQEAFEQAMSRQQDQIAELQADRQQLERRKTAREMEARDLEHTLSKLIEEEMEIQQQEEERRRELMERREQRIAEAENIRGSSAASGASAIPAEAELEEISDRFEQRKGSLPWPVSEGTISEQFGDRENPLYGTRIYNPGVQISTSSGNEVMAVHDGYVFAVRPMPGYGNTVFVNHGRYNTVYGNLSEVSVSRNTVLEEGDIIGKSGDENTLNGQVLFFMISEGSADHFDPEQWMSKP